MTEMMEKDSPKGWTSCRSLCKAGLLFTVPGSVSETQGSPPAFSSVQSRSRRVRANFKRCDDQETRMAMLIYKPKTDTLDDVSQEAEEETRNWQQDYLRGLADELAGDPIRYRSCPYWWLLKKTLISAGCTAFGEYIDQEWYDRRECHISVG